MTTPAPSEVIIAGLSLAEAVKQDVFRWHKPCVTPLRHFRRSQEFTMNIASSVATSRLMAQERAMDVTASNLANMTTPGYRATRVQFADWLSPQRGGAVPPGGQTIAYTQDRATWRDQRTGPLAQTGNPLDMALPGDGYFSVATVDGPRLTKAGRFALTADGTIANASGQALLDTNNRPIQIPANETQITIAPDGSIRGRQGALGKVGVVRPEDPARMQPIGDNLFRTDGPTQQVERPKVLQGMLEGANVEPVRETTRMMRELREFQFAAQFVQAESERLQSAIDRILRPRAL